VERYTEWCNAHNIPAFPMSYETVGDFLCHLVDTRNGSAKSVGNNISFLRTFCMRAGITFLSDLEEARLKALRKNLEETDPFPVRRVKPITHHMIMSFISRLDPIHNKLHLMQTVILLLLYFGCLRGGDIFSPWNYLRPGDIDWSIPGRVTITLGPLKNNRTVSGGTAIIFDHPGKSAYKYLWLWFSTNNLWHRRDCYLFPMPYRSRRIAGRILMDFHLPASKIWLDHMVIDVVTSLGLNASDYSAHSFRVGFATEMLSQPNISTQMVMSMGRWASDAILVYFRNKALGPQLVAQAIAAMLEGY